MDLLAGRYQLLERLGAGGMGEVHAARDVETGREVAVKVLSDVNDLELVGRFVREAEAVARIEHAAVVRSHGLVVPADGSAPLLVLERLRGETLEARLARGNVPPIEAARIGSKLLAGLAAAHAQGIVHRDVKPSNVFLEEDGGVKLIDFGVAKLLGDRGLTRTGVLVGTPMYMAPEQVRGDPIDARVDVYGVGATLYEAITGEPPFLGSAAKVMKASVFDELRPIRDRAPDLDPALAAIVHGALAKDPGLRFESADAMRARLDAWIGVASAAKSRPIIPARPSASPPASPSPPARPRTRRATGRWLALGGVGALVASVAVGTLAAIGAGAPTGRRAVVLRTLQELPPPTPVDSPPASASVTLAAPPSASAPASARPSRRIYLVGRGTSGVEDWTLANDVEAALKRWVSTSGLAACFDLDNAACKNPILVTITGHSEGGLVSIEAAFNNCHSAPFEACTRRAGARPFRGPFVPTQDWMATVAVGVQ